MPLQPLHKVKPIYNYLLTRFKDNSNCLWGWYTQQLLHSREKGSSSGKVSSYWIKIVLYHFVLQSIQKPAYQIFWCSCIITDFIQPTH